MDTPHINVFLHPASFEHLQQITDSEQLTKHIRKVTVTGHTLRSRPLGDREAEDWTLDGDVLVQAFKSFPNLESIQVDSFPIFEHETGQGVLQCGADSIGDLDDNDTDVDSRVYDLVLQALFDADKHLSVTIHLDFPSLIGDTLPELSLNSAYWAACSSQVCSLAFSGYANTEWHRTLLQSTPSLNQLTFNSCEELDLKELTQNISPGLRSFELDDAFCVASELREFLDCHQNSMAKVQMNNVSISDDIWPELRELMKNMPRLEELDLSELGVHSN